ncbi:hypothetical protein L484_002780 [Morus notabilis]|uniref:LysM domain-containing protein n=1 Tax=Morus notabilis TaxID=981085 RepID=W9QEA8_9ROSA|nr:hypothetical protein L484_002780 [Morus notabilis]
MEGHRDYRSKWSYRLSSVHNSTQIKHFSGSGDSSTSNGVGGSESGKQAAADSLHKAEIGKQQLSRIEKPAFNSHVNIIGLLGLIAVGIGKSESRVPKCDSVYGVQSGDTCFEVTQMFNLTTAFFGSVNPNLNCTALFVGQWLCTAGTPN